MDSLAVLESTLCKYDMLMTKEKENDEMIP